jgi:hypothetical protein
MVGARSRKSGVPSQKKAKRILNRRQLRKQSFGQGLLAGRFPELLFRSAWVGTHPRASIERGQAGVRTEDTAEKVLSSGF